MGLMGMSDREICEIAKPILLDTIYGANNKDWVQFSKHMPENVLLLWRELVFLIFP